MAFLKSSLNRIRCNTHRHDFTTLESYQGGKWSISGYGNLQVNSRNLVSCYKSNCSMVVEKHKLWLWLASFRLGAATAIRHEANIQSRPQSLDYYAMVREGPENLAKSNFHIQEDVKSTS